MTKVFLALLIALFATALGAIYMYLLLTMAFGLVVVSWTALITLPLAFVGFPIFAATLMSEG